VTSDAQRLVRFIRAAVKPHTDQSCEATVEIELRGVGVFTASAAGPIDDQLRAVARATADTLSDAFDAKGVKVRVVSVQLVDSVTHRRVLVTVAASRGADHRTLVGVCDATGDPVRAAALAVLNATNRYLAL
jgi:3-methyladenine DNA glycosylase AlkD